jgi:hypothetical protein
MPGALERRARQKQYREWGIGIVREVGIRGWFIVDWENGEREEFNKVDLHVFANREFAAMGWPRLYPS